MCCFPFLYHMTTTLFAKDQKPKTIVSLFFYLIGPSHMHEQEEKGQRLLHVAGRQRQTEAPESSESQPAQPPPPLREGKAEPAAPPAPLSPACPHPPYPFLPVSPPHPRPVLSLSCLIIPARTGYPRANFRHHHHAPPHATPPPRRQLYILGQNKFLADSQFL